MPSLWAACKPRLYQGGLVPAMLTGGLAAATMCVHRKHSGRNLCCLVTNCSIHAAPGCKWLSRWWGGARRDEKSRCTQSTELPHLWAGITMHTSPGRPDNTPNRHAQLTCFVGTDRLNTTLWGGRYGLHSATNLGTLLILLAKPLLAKRQA